MNLAIVIVSAAVVALVVILRLAVSQRLRAKGGIPDPGQPRGG
jgi:hypothetical protein